MNENFNKADDIIKNAIAILLFKDSYWGYLMAKLKRVSDETLPYIMGVGSGQDSQITLYYNPILIESVDEPFILKAIEHEGMHILNNHIGRLLIHLTDEVNKNIKQDKMKIWNIASDYAVNSLINFPKSKIINGEERYFLFPEDSNLPNLKTSEFYYDKLLEELENFKNNQDEESKDLDESNNKKEEKSSDLSNNNSLKNESNNENQKSSDFVDDHDKWIEDIKECPDLRSMARKLESYTKEIIKQSSDEVKNRGHIPGFVKSVIDNYFLKPKVSYYHVIAKLIKGSKFSKIKNAYSKINKKRTYLFSITEDNIPQISPFPGKTKDTTFKICIIIDTSGSMSDLDVLRGLSGAKNIIENDRDCKTTIIEIDTQINRIYDIKRISDIKFDIHGRGGTCLFEGLAYAKKENYDVALVFTDGYCENFNNINRKLLPKKIIWVITPNGTSNYVNGVGFTLMLDYEKNIL